MHGLSNLFSRSVIPCNFHAMFGGKQVNSPHWKSTENPLEYDEEIGGQRN